MASSASCFSVGLNVWVKNVYVTRNDVEIDKYREAWLPSLISDEPLYVPAKVLDVNKLSIKLVTLLEPKMMVSCSLPTNEIFPMNSHLLDLPLSSLKHLHEPEVMYVLSRSTLGSPIKAYVPVNATSLVHVNSFRSSHENAEKIQVDNSALFQFLENIVAKMVNRVDASTPFSIICNGVRSSGKSETMKLALEYLVSRKAMRECAISQDELSRSRNHAFPLGSFKNPFLSQPLLANAEISSIGIRHKADESYLFTTAVKNNRFIEEDEVDKRETDIDPREIIASKLSIVERSVLSAMSVVDAFGSIISSLMIESGKQTLHTCVLRSFACDFKAYKSDKNNVQVTSCRIETGALDTGVLVRTNGSNYFILFLLAYGSPIFLRNELALSNGSFAILGSYASLHFLSNESILSHLKNDFMHIVRCMQEAGVSPSSQQIIWKSLAAILHLGNIVPHDPKALQILTQASNLLTIPLDSMKRLISPKQMQLGLPLIRSFMHGVFTRTFSFLIDRMNDHFQHLELENISSSSKENGMMNLLLDGGKSIVSTSGCIKFIDGPGFTDSNVVGNNAFSSFQGSSLISSNYAYEKLEELFTTSTLSGPVHFYDAEHVKLSSQILSYVDNANLTQMFDNPVLGLFSIIEEMQSFDRATEQGISDRFLTSHSKNDLLKTSKTNKNEFAITHALGDVSYSLKGVLFDVSLSKHSDIDDLLALVDELLSIKSISSSSSQLISLHSILRGLAKTEAFFIRCFSSNPTGRPCFVKQEWLSAQLQSSNLIPGLAMQHAMFPCHMLFRDFYMRYLSLISSSSAASLGLVFPPSLSRSIRDQCRFLMDEISHSLPAHLQASLSSQVSFGATRIFLKQALHDELESTLSNSLKKWDYQLIQIQALWRGYRVRRVLQTSKRGISLYQAAWRSVHFRMIFQKQNVAATVIQRKYLTWRTRCKFQQKRGWIILLQRRHRVRLEKKHWKTLQLGIRSLHSLVRGFLVRKHVDNLALVVMKIQSLWRGYKTRKFVNALRTKAVIKIQACWRGYNFRIMHEDYLLRIHEKLEQSLKRKAACIIATWWKKNSKSREEKILEVADMLMKRLVDDGFNRV
jgi:Myosin head (motor domain)/IQ calmodulin-binding motif